MTSDDFDKEKLHLSAHALANALTRCATVPKLKRLRLRKAEFNGWWVDIVQLNDSLSICLFLDHMVSDTERGYWVGFSSIDERAMRKIVRTRPKGMPVREWAEPPIDTGVPIEEYWDAIDTSYFGIYFEPGMPLDICRALGFICEVLPTIPGFETAVKVDAVGLDIVALENDPSLIDQETTRKQLINARIGQGDYRRELDREWDSKCAVLGISNRSVLRASHAKPWKLANNAERLDKNNGLLLAAHLDALFDVGLITFASTGQMLIADELPQSDRDALNLGGALRKKPSPELADYLNFHQANCYKG